MDAKHTPGPWVADDPDHLSAELIDDNYHFVDAQRGDLHIAFCGTLADARLIAAAPELLSIAQRWTALDAGAWNSVRYEREKAELIAETNTIVAKATGSAA